MEPLHRDLTHAQMRIKRRWQVVGGVSWTLCYTWLIIHGIQTRRWCLPLFTNVCFWAHELKSLYVCTTLVYSPLQRTFTLIWVALDSLVIFLFVLYADVHDYPFQILNILHASRLLTILALTILFAILFFLLDRYLQDLRGVRTGFVLCVMLPLEDILSQILWRESKTYCGLHTVGCLLTLVGNFGYWIGFRYQTKHWTFVRRVGYIFLPLQVIQLFMTTKYL